MLPAKKMAQKKTVAQKKSITNQQPNPEAVFSVEGIVEGPRVADGKFLIKWTGFFDSQNTWETRSYFSAKLLKEFEQKKITRTFIAAHSSIFEEIAAAALGNDVSSQTKPEPAISKPTTKGQTSSSDATTSGVGTSSTSASAVPVSTTKGQTSSIDATTSEVATSSTSPSAVPVPTAITKAPMLPNLIYLPSLTRL